MYRTSLTLACCVLYSAAGAASDLSSVYVAPGGIYAPSANVYVRPDHPSALRGTRYGYRQPYLWRSRLPRAGSGMATTNRLCRAACLTSTACRSPGSGAYCAANATRRTYEYAPRPRSRCPYRYLLPHAPPACCYDELAGAT